MSRRLHAPDDEDKPFIARWNVLVRILLVESSVKAVARSAMDFADFDDGSSCHPSNERIERETGLSERTVRTAWQVLRGLGMAERVGYGSPHRKLADEYQLVIPEWWQSLPIYGPHVRKFTCLYCQKLITPQGNCAVKVDGDKEKIAFQLRRMVFCPAPRATKGRDALDCLTEWNESQRHDGERTWNQLGDDTWKLFRQARADEW
ncbi:helix-turn-helix domain-containing protein [Micromonospora sp. NPDC049891]|uniref:helix-turn-helix domain-containing protein n=1 Tax=Micromonospora sp. NPDC049891 TaxID=3155655 RepID=UPI0033D924EA